MKYTDFRDDEQERKISIKAKPMTLLLENSNSKHYVLNIVDTPGHINFLDEVYAAVRLADGVVCVIDVIEGVGALSDRSFTDRCLCRRNRC